MVKQKKEKAVRYFAGFLLLMLVFTLVSRGIYAYGLAQVETEGAQRKAITHQIEVSGTLQAVSEKAVVTEPDIRVSEVCVREGDTVDKDAVLFRLDEEQLAKEIETAKKEKQILLQQRKETEEEIQAQKEKAELDRQRAQEDLASVTGEQDARIAKLTDSYNRAQKDQAEFPSFADYLKEARKQSSEYQAMKQAAEREDAAGADKKAFKSYSRQFTDTIKAEWEEKKKGLQTANEEAQWNLEQASDDRKNAVRQANREVEDTASGGSTKQSGVLELAQDIEQKEAQITIYQKLLDAGGAVTAPVAGRVKKLAVSVGEKTVDGTAVLLADSTQGYDFTAQITEEERKYISMDDLVTITVGEDKMKLTELAIEAIDRCAEGGYKLRVRVKEKGITENDMAALSFTSDSGIRECCVPLSALYASQTETYVLLLREAETFLGTQFYVEKRIVMVEDKNNEYAALKDSPLSDQDQVVTMSDRAVSPGDQVRMLEEYE